MHIIVKVIIAIAMSVFWLYMSFHKGRSIGRRDLAESEQSYLLTLQLWHMFSLIIIAVIIFGD